MRHPILVWTTRRSLPLRILKMLRLHDGRRRDLCTDDVFHTMWARGEGAHKLQNITDVICVFQEPTAHFGTQIPSS